MSLQRRKVYICDSCNAVALPGIDNAMAYGWRPINRHECLCPVCYEAYNKIVLDKRKAVNV